MIRGAVAPGSASHAVAAARPRQRAPYYSDLTMRAFELFFLPWRARRLITRIVDMPGAVPGDAPVLLVANHTSWWDGFLLRDVQRTLRPRSPLYSVMTAHELERNPFLRRIGAVPLEQTSSGSVLTMLRALRGVARDRRGVTISYFPQGRIAPAWQRPLGFHRGVELVVRAVQPCWIIPVGLHIEPLNRTKPTAFISAGAPMRADGAGVTVDDLEGLVTQRLDRIAALLLDGSGSPAQTEEYAS